MREISVRELYEYIDSLKVGCQYDRLDMEKVIRGFSSLGNYKKDTLTWIKSAQMLGDIQQEKLLFAIAEEDCGISRSKNIIFCRNSKAVFFDVLQHFWGEGRDVVIWDTSVIETTALGENVSIGHNCYIGKNVWIGDNVVIENNVQIQCPCRIGSNTHIWSGVVIGTDGFGYYDMSDGSYGKVPHFGGVVIGKNVEIGANTCIDRGTLDDTIIEDGVKIDNLCHIGHNVHIGRNSMVIALSMLGGSAVLEEHVYCAPGVLVRNQIRMGRNSFAGMGAVVTKDVLENQVVAGVPAKYLRER